MMLSPNVFLGSEASSEGNSLGLNKKSHGHLHLFPCRELHAKGRRTRQKELGVKGTEIKILPELQGQRDTPSRPRPDPQHRDWAQV